MKRKNLIWTVSICMFIAYLILIIWIRKTYGVLSLATVDDSFIHFFKNKRILLIKEVVFPSILVFFCLCLLQLILQKKKVAFETPKMLCSSITLAVFVIFWSVALLDMNSYVKMQYRQSKPQWYEMDRVVVHALGEIDGLTYTNSKEALENSYQKGQRLFECDFIMTSDEQVVACHDWDIWNEWKVDNTESYIPTLDEFMDVKIMQNYTPMSELDILMFLKTHPDVYIITDTKEAEPELVKNQFETLVNLAIANDCETVLDRFVVQIYHAYMYDIIEDIYSFDNYIFTLYQEAYRGEAEKMKEYAEYCRLHDIDVITMDANFFDEDLLDICQQYDIELFVHTVNDYEEIKTYLNKGVGIYSDLTGM